MRISFEPLGRPPRSLAARIAAAVLGVFAFGLAMMFSALIFAGLALAGLTLWAYFWWKTRALRRTMREEMRAPGFGTPADERWSRTGGANVIEGEAVRVMDEERLTTAENAEKPAANPKDERQEI
jgi:hypothetical protein